MGILDWVEGTAIAIWVRESPSLFAYTGVLSAHAMGLAIAVGVNTAVALRVLGVASSIPLQPLDRLFPLMYFGLVINALSGFALLAANPRGMLGNVIFLIKLGFIVCAVFAMLSLRNRVFSAAALGRAVPVPREGRTLAILCLAFWLGAVVTGRLTAYPNFVRAFLGL